METQPPVSQESAESITVLFDSSVNYAFQQNVISIIKEIRLHNGQCQRENLRLKITAEPMFAEPFELHIQSLRPGQELVIAPVDLKLRPLFLAELNERVSSLLRVELWKNDTLTASQSETIELLARNEWCGLCSLPEILATFVLPNDPAVTAILSRAVEILGMQTGSRAFTAIRKKQKIRLGASGGDLPSHRGTACMLHRRAGEF